jgi:hypothetical protein
MDVTHSLWSRGGGGGERDRTGVPHQQAGQKKKREHLIYTRPNELKFSCPKRELTPTKDLGRSAILFGDIRACGMREQGGKIVPKHEI